MIGAVRKINHLKYPSSTIKCTNYAKYDHKKFRNDVSEIDWSLVYSSNDVMLQSLTVNGRDCKWLNAEIKSEMNSRNQLHRKARRSRKERVWKIHKKQRNKCNNLIKKAKASYHRNLFEENARNPKKFWNCIKAVFPSTSCRIQTCTNLNLNSTVKTFSSYFSEAVKKLKSLTYPLENFTW